MKVDKSNDYVNVQLMEDATQLSEVVVTGYGEKKVDGEPMVIGRTIGGRCVMINIWRREDVSATSTRKQNRRQTVIEFTIGATGTISDFTVVKKFGFGCDEEVIRLVKEGGLVSIVTMTMSQWKVWYGSKPASELPEEVILSFPARPFSGFANGQIFLLLGLYLTKFMSLFF